MLIILLELNIIWKIFLYRESKGIEFLYRMFHCFIHDNMSNKYFSDIFPDRTKFWRIKHFLCCQAFITSLRRSRDLAKNFKVFIKFSTFMMYFCVMQTHRVYAEVDYWQYVNTGFERLSYKRTGEQGTCYSKLRVERCGLLEVLVCLRNFHFIFI